MRKDIREGVRDRERDRERGESGEKTEERGKWERIFHQCDKKLTD